MNDLLDRLNNANDWQEHQWPVVFRAAERITRLEQEKADLLAALKALKSAVSKEPSMQGRDFISLCIRVNDAINKAERPSQERREEGGRASPLGD